MACIGIYITSFAYKAQFESTCKVICDKSLDADGCRLLLDIHVDQYGTGDIHCSCL